MVKPVPFLFCRYALHVDEEALDPRGQLEALKELQGKYYAHGEKAHKERRFDTVVMRPRSFAIDRRTVLTWSIGQQIGARETAKYNGKADDIEHELKEDDGLRYADFIAIPSLGVLAIDDRTGDTKMGGRPGISRFRSVFRQLKGADADIILDADTHDIDRALGAWRVTQFMFTVRPYNPHSPGEMADITHAKMKARNVRRETGKWEAESGKGIVADEEVKGIVELASAGYGQVSLKGVTPQGHVAQIKRPPFSEDLEQNLKAQERRRELRVFIEPRKDDESVVKHDVATALISFYGNDKTPKVS